ncbi:MAG: alpha/beta hydrolase [Ketobacter sp.]|nr:MAG: alpha/beta hydrolase [Ketobacter sp.]
MIIHFAHANGVPAASYTPLFKELAPHQVIFKPKYGHDPRYPYTDNWTWLADELNAFVEANSNEPVVAVGHSLGAILSFIAACKRPDLYKGVLMLDPPLIWGSGSWVFKLAKLFGQSDRITPAGKSKFRRAHWPNREQAVEYFASKRLFQFAPECFEAFCDAALTSNEGNGTKLEFDVAVEVGIFRNVPDNLKHYKKPDNVPFKLIRADKSNASKAAFIDPFLKFFGIPGAVISGEHMYPLQQPGLAIELINQFLEEIERAN